MRSGQRSALPTTLPSSKRITVISAWLWIAGLLAVVWLMPNTQELFRRYGMLGPTHPVPDSPLLAPLARLRWCPSRAWAWAMAIIALVAVLRFGRATEFIYFQF
jgi:alginate O-acetyltransferase complex protein AlgI